MNARFQKAPPPPYYAVIFTSLRTPDDPEGYGRMADAMLALGQTQPGYLGFETARGEDGVGITVSYWKDEASIRAWKQVADHRAAQGQGRKEWYAWYHVRVARVERGYSFRKNG
jgi:heme-degrading monooxygenase HmoA